MGLGASTVAPTSQTRTKWLGRCQLCLNRPDAVYFTGDTLYGRLIITANKPVQLSKLKASLRASLGYLEIKAFPDAEALGRHYVNHMIHQTIVVICGGKQPECELHEGENEFEFKIPIKASCPTSFGSSDDYPHVCYVLSIGCNRAGHVTGHECLATLPIHVLRREPAATAPSKPHSRITVSNHTESLTVSSDKRVYEAPELIYLQLKLSNPKARKMGSITCSLLQRITVESSTLERCFSRTTVELNMTDVSWHGRAHLTLPGFHLQASETSVIKGSIEVDIAYVVHGTLCDGCGNNMLAFDIPVTLKNSQEKALAMIKVP